MLARLVLRSPSIVILDEPTASLDEGTELLIIERMKAWLGERTLIVATHRFALLALVDRIIVVDGGRIVLNGAKDEVLRVLSGKGPAQPAQQAEPGAAPMTALLPSIDYTGEIRPGPLAFVADHGVARHPLRLVGPLPNSTRSRSARARSRPASKGQIIQSLEGGILAELSVREGDIVEAGQNIATLDPVLARASMEEALAKIASLKARAARLEAEMNDETGVTFPADLREDMPVVERERQLFAANRSALAENVANLREQLQLARDELEIAAPLLKTGASKPDRGAAPAAKGGRTLDDARVHAKRISCGAEGRFRPRPWPSSNRC